MRRSCRPCLSRAAGGLMLCRSQAMESNANAALADAAAREEAARKAKAERDKALQEAHDAAEEAQKVVSAECRPMHRF